MRKLALVLTLLVLGIVRTAHAQTTVVKLCTAVGSGCDALPTMANLNAAVVTAAALSTATNIYIENGATLTGTLVLRHRAVGVTALVTIRSGVDSAGNLTSAGIWPDATDRLWPPSYTGVTIESGHATNYTGSLAKLVAAGTNESTVLTVLPSETGSGCSAAPCIAHHYKLELLDISGPAVSAGVIVALGSQAVSGDVPSGDTQNTAAEEPHNITLSQVYVHGTDAGGCLHGVMVAAKDVTIQHSYISNCWWAGSDAQAIWWINTTGGLTVTNNYLEASGEVFIAGGDTPRMNFTSSGITLSASSTTTATLTAALPDYMRTGDCVSVLVSAVKAQSCIASIDPSGGNPRRLITFSPALSAAPDVPGMMRGGVVMRDLTVTGNWMNTPVAWRGTSKGNTRKNIFELKVARNATITGNLFTHVWHIGQNGYAIVFTPINQDGGNDSSQIANIVFSFNRVQHMVGCFNISGIDGDNAFSQRTDGIAISNTSCEDMSSTAWGTDTFPAIAIGTGSVPARMYPKNLTFDHVYLDHRAGNALFLISNDANTAPKVAALVKAEGFTLKNSIFRNPSSGPLGFYYSDEFAAQNSGVDSWNAATTSGVCLSNSWSREPSGQWTFCTGSNFPTTLAEQDGALVDYGTDYSVDQGCGAASATCYDNAATDGSDLGPNWSILLDYYGDALNGTPGGGETPPPEPPPTTGVIEELTIDNISTLAARNLLLIPDADLILNPTGKEVLPGAGYDINIGRNTRKFLTGHFAEIWSSLLVALDVMSTIGGRVMVAPTTVLTSDLGAGDTTIAVKHNNLQNGDRLYLEGGLNVEFMAVTSSASGSGPFIYDVARSLDPTGPNDWSAGDAVVNTGTTGNGFIDLYSVRGAHAATEIGPSIVFNQRTSTTYNAWEPRAAIGNLDGLYGFSGSTYGFAAGVPSGARLTLTPASGLTIYGGDNDAKVTIDAVGNATFDGRVTVGTGRNQIRNSECRVGTDEWTIATNTSLTQGMAFYLSGGGWPYSLNSEPNTCYFSVTGTPVLDTISQAYESTLHPVAPGGRYEVSAYLNTYRTGGTTVSVQFLDAGGSQVGIVSSAPCAETAVSGDILENYCRTGTIGTAPASAINGRLVITTGHTGTGTDPFVFWVRTYFGEASPAQEELTEWGPAGITEITNGLIKTGAINARTIEAHSVTADQILAGTLTSLELAPGSVTESELAANAVTAAAIASGTITGTQIAGGTITTTHIAANSINSTHIQANSVDADRMNVSTLSAISANLGSIVAGSITGITISGSTINAGSGNEVTLNNSGITLAGGTGTNNRLKWSGGHEMWGTTGGIYTNGSFSIEDVLVVGGEGSGAIDLSVDDIGVATQIQFVNMPISTGTAVIWENSCGCLKKVSSSSRYKERITPWFATDAQRLLTVTPIRFDYRGDGAKGVVGLSAEDLYLVAPEAVNLDAQGRPDSVRQDAVNAYLIQIIKELRDEIAALKARNK